MTRYVGVGQRSSFAKPPVGYGWNEVDESSILWTDLKTHFMMLKCGVFSFLFGFWKQI